MINQIIIKNFAIIDHLDIELFSGMTALTGETGAGKSILLNALQLVLGDRADSDTVKSDCEKAEVTVSFNIDDNPTAQQWLSEYDIEDDSDLIIRRVITQNGRSKAYINGTPSPLSQLKSLGALLVDLHGQHEHQSLQKNDVQLDLLDQNLNQPDLINDVSLAYKSWQHIKKQLADIINGQANKQQRIDLLKLYTQELNQLALKKDELQKLEQEHKVLAAADELIKGSHQLSQQLMDSDDLSIFHQLNQCVQNLNDLAQIDASLKNTAELLNTASIQVQEASSELNQYQQNIEYNNERLTWLDERIASSYQLAQKHHVDQSELPILTEQLNLELETLNESGNDSEAHAKLEVKLKQQYLELSLKLSKLRTQQASKLSKQVTNSMQQLGMQGGQFNIAVKPDDSIFKVTGFDQIVFEISANPGQQLKPLTRVASGGELSRMSLAIQVILAQSSDIDTMIFDEVDSGIGGGIAEIVGQKLRLIGSSKQVICITHLAQVASQAHQHYQVIKQKSDTQTKTYIAFLSEEARKDEIARMIGGINITAQTKAHASEMLNLAE